MLTSTPQADAAAPPRNGLATSGPILAICCLLFILFLIAATIILALIPVYVSSTSGTRVTRSSSFKATLTAQNASRLFSERNLDSQSLTNIANAIAATANLPTGSLVASAGTASESSGKRRRRGFGLVRERRLGNVIYVTLSLDTVICPQCPGKATQKAIQEGYIVAEVYINYGGDGTATWVVLRFYYVIDYTQSAIPQTSTAASSTSGTTAMG